MSAVMAGSIAVLRPSDKPQPNLGFLSGGNEMGERTRAMDWANTPAGAVETWPASLKTAVSICLGSRHPMVVWWGRAAYTQFYNDAYISFLGSKHPDCLGQSARDCWREIWPVIGPMLEGVYATGEATWSEDLLLVLDRHLPREETYFTFSYSPIRGDDGSVAGIFCACNETTARVIGERRLKTLRDLNRVVAEAQTPDGACEVVARVVGDNLGDVPYALIYLLDGEQARLAAVSGLVAGSAVAPERIDLKETERPPIWPLTRALELSSGQRLFVATAQFAPLPGGLWPEPSEAAVLVPIAAPGQARPTGFLIAGLSPRRVIDADYEGFLELLAGHIGTAISNARAHEEQRRRAEALAEIDRAKTVFFSNVSHEFRTPLTLMLGPLEEAAADPAVPAYARSQLELVQRNSLRLLKLVNSLLDFSRIEAGRVDACYERTDLAAATTDLASTFRSAMERADLRFAVECDPLNELVYVDREMWEKIVLNLLSNAFKFTFRGSVVVRLRQQQDQAVLEISDTGAGIPEHELPRLFERFHRVEGTMGRTQEGSGIGLAMVQELVKLHGGTICVASELGTGTTFRVTVPFGTAHLPPERLEVSRSRVSTAVGAQAFVQEALRWIPSKTCATRSSVPALADSPLAADRHFAATAGARILLADDNADMRAYVSDLLAPVYTVEAVPDGQQALEAIRRERPDLVLSDVMMPRLDGFGLLTALRQDDALRQIPVILLSARAGQESRIEGLEAGADDYLIKPFSARELQARVGATLTLARERRAFEQHIATDLEAMRRLRELGERCNRHSRDFRYCLDSIIEAAIFITGADKGNIQLLEQESNAFKIVAHRGFELSFLDFFASIQSGESSVRGAAMLAAERIVVEDVQHSELFRGTAALEILTAAGVRAVQSTPLVSSTGKLLGMISTHFGQPRRPSEQELRLIELLARQTADYLERRQAHDALQASEIRFRTIVDASPAALMLLSAEREDDQIVDFRWTYLNKPAQQVFCDPIGRAVDAIIGKRIHETLPASWDHSDLFNSLVRAVETRSPQEIEVHSRATGIPRTFLNLVVPFADGVLVWFVDVTAQKFTEEQLREADRHKNEFLAMLAHELRNPLAPIGNAGEYLARALPDDPKTQTAIGVIRRQTTHLTRLVDDLLEVSRIVEGRIQLRRHPLDIAPVVAQAVETVQPQMQAKQHRLLVTSSSYEPLYVHADSARLVQCLVNVLGNAAKYTEPHGQIRLETGAEAGSVIIEISDNGVGIAPELLPRIFDLFVQSDRTLDRAQGGLGIGLAVVKRLVEMQDGRVRVSSPGVGLGATLQIRLPRIAPPQTSATQAPAATSVRRRVLIVDDNIDAAESLALLLGLQGHEVVVSYSARDALERIASFGPEVALLDLGLPEIDGYELARKLRAQPQLASLRLVALTGYGQAEDRQRTRVAGFDDHLIKPVELTALERSLVGHSACAAASPKYPLSG